MRKIPFPFLFLSAILCAFVTLGSASAQTSAASTVEQNAAALLERHQALAAQLASNAYARPIYLESIEAVQLDAEKGPLGTKNYRIDLQAVSLPEGKTFIHLRFSYGFGMVSKLAMLGYMATAG